MIYINQIGQTELGRGETLEAAVADANSRGCNVTADIRLHRAGWPTMDGEVVYCDEPLGGYNDLDTTATLHNLKTGESIRPATATELAASIEASKTDGGTGAIVVDGVTCYVQE